MVVFQPLIVQALLLSHEVNPSSSHWIALPHRQIFHCNCSVALKRLVVLLLAWACGSPGSGPCNQHHQ
jgi:hypothetical protein